jgi:hypothetical protein
MPPGSRPDDAGGRASGNGMSRGGGGVGLRASSSSAKLGGHEELPPTMMTMMQQASSNLPSSSSLPPSNDYSNPYRRKNREPISSVKGNWTQEEDDMLQKCVSFFIDIFFPSMMRAKARSRERRRARKFPACPRQELV